MLQHAQLFQHDANPCASMRRQRLLDVHNSISGHTHVCRALTLLQNSFLSGGINFRFSAGGTKCFLHK